MSAVTRAEPDDDGLAVSGPKDLYATVKLVCRVFSGDPGRGLDFTTYLLGIGEWRDAG